MKMLDMDKKNVGQNKIKKISDSTFFVSNFFLNFMGSNFLSGGPIFFFERGVHIYYLICGSNIFWGPIFFKFYGAQFFEWWSNFFWEGVQIYYLIWGSNFFGVQLF